MTTRIIFGLAAVALTATIAPSVACSPLTFSRAITVAEMVAGLDVIFAGTVVGYVTEDGQTLLGPIPRECGDEYSPYVWREGQAPVCRKYQSVSAALFHVDAHVVGPEQGEIVSEFMTWGDGDCNIDYQVGDKWLIAGFWYTQPLPVPLEESEVTLLRRLASHPKFDFESIPGTLPAVTPQGRVF